MYIGERPAATQYNTNYTFSKEGNLDYFQYLFLRQMSFPCKINKRNKSSIFELHKYRQLIYGYLAGQYSIERNLIH